MKIMNTIKWKQTHQREFGDNQNQRSGNVFTITKKMCGCPPVSGGDMFQDFQWRDA